MFPRSRTITTHVKVVNPSLAGIDVSLDATDAEIIVRWRHPGKDGLRSIDKYRYSPGGMEWSQGQIMSARGGE